jgi:hypothetical protein
VNSKSNPKPKQSKPVSKRKVQGPKKELDKREEDDDSWMSGNDMPLEDVTAMLQSMKNKIYENPIPRIPRITMFKKTKIKARLQAVLTDIKNSFDSCDNKDIEDDGFEILFAYAEYRLGKHIHTKIWKRYSGRRCSQNTQDTVSKIGWRTERCQREERNHDQERCSKNLSQKNPH